MRATLPRVLPMLRLLTILAGLAACASQPPATGLRAITILADAHANHDNGTALDLVFVYDSSVLAVLPKSGPDWFDKKAVLVPGLATALEVVSLEIPPAKLVSLPAGMPFPARYRKAIGVVGYANYIAPGGQAMFNLTPYATVDFALAWDTVTLKGQAPKSLADKMLGLFSSKAPPR